eukprot:6184113-Pleurochrysis_carterae.AAC.1
MSQLNFLVWSTSFHVGLACRWVSALLLQLPLTWVVKECFTAHARAHAACQAAVPAVRQRKCATHAATRVIAARTMMGMSEEQ